MSVRVLVPVSGGKDSQACLQLACEHYPKHEILGLFCNTQFEHPLTYQHVRETLPDMYGVKIEEVCEGDVLSKVEHYGRFPSDIARFCTDELKIRPTKRFCKALAEKQGGFELWYGMRSEESAQRKKRYAGKLEDELYMPHEVMPSKYPQYLGKKLGVKFRLAILNWSTFDVLDYLDGRENPLYSDFDRVGCFPCLAAGDPHKAKAFNHDDFGHNQRRVVQIAATRIGKSVWTSKGGQARNGFDGCSLCAT